eukprot:CAMPEP_0174294320 /NCGR_PEP_ID=MMETSP0809-20121228/41279_1 /TAXON_ID=73025 ORGANISM="Eutreptiella gymnastica-like, Strain CCMP1594" /NCGR_SAMPLE_ID=MMETSP0809 /ASSEMBLY_ACC=CAM_ASM_000658 /LENGTH=84 /DNA_ID=CAMNT_0015395681 /DNA_START=31 /DNA_END=281 /DNA_ORIENTATION=-
MRRSEVPSEGWTAGLVTWTAGWRCGAQWNQRTGPWGHELRPSSASPYILAASGLYCRIKQWRNACALSSYQCMAFKAMPYRYQA